MAQQSVRFEQFFAAPRQKVFAWFSHHENLARLFGGRLIDTAPGPDSEQPLGAGAVRVVRFGLMRVEETVTCFEPPQRIEYRVTHGWPIADHHGRLSFSEVEGGTHLDYTIEFRVRLAGVGSVMAGVLCASWRRNIHRAVDAISSA